MNKKTIYIYSVYTICFGILWLLPSSAMLLYNKSSSVPVGLYIRQFSNKKISCNTVYVAIDPIWIMEKFPILANTLRRQSTMIIKYIDDTTKQVLIKTGRLPQYVEVYAQHTYAITSALLGAVPRQYIHGIYCFLTKIK